MKKNMRLLVTLILVLTLGLVACGKFAVKEKEQEVAKQTSEETKNPQDSQETDKPEEKPAEEKAPEAYYPVTVQDRFGNDVVIEKEPQKVISISPEMTETLFAIGVGERLVGRTDYCDYPAQVLEVESIGSLYEVNMEKVIALEADVVFASSHVKDETIKLLSDQGVKVVALSWNENLDGVYSYMTTIGQVMNRNKETEELVTKMKDVFDKEMKAIADRERPTAYFITGFGEYGDFTATGDTFLGQLIEMAGAINAAADGTNWSYSIEKLVEKDPQWLFCSKSYDSKAQIEALDGYKELTAVKEGRLIEVDENTFFRQGPRLVDGFVTLVRTFYPETGK